MVSKACINKKQVQVNLSSLSYLLSRSTFLGVLHWFKRFLLLCFNERKFRPYKRDSQVHVPVYDLAFFAVFKCIGHRAHLALCDLSGVQVYRLNTVRIRTIAVINSLFGLWEQVYFSSLTGLGGA
jgi:hypothetical protein